MKALSLTQPWATLIAIEAKRYETRSWQTFYRGQLAIHAAKGLGPVGGKRGLVETCGEEPFRDVLNAYAQEYLKTHSGLKSLVDDALMPLGAIVATCSFTACWPTEELRDKMSAQELAFGDFSDGRFMWRMINVWKLPRPIPCKGALGLWEIPAEIEAEIQSQVTHS